MAENVNYPAENQLGCGFMTIIFHNGFFWQRRSSSKPLVPSTKTINPTKFQGTIDKSDDQPLPRIDQKPYYSEHNLKRSRKSSSDSARSSTSSSSNRSALKKGSVTRVPSGNIIVSSPKKCHKPVDSDKQLGPSLVTSSSLRKNSEEMSKFGNICKGITIKDPEVAKNLGNEKYKMGRFSEALAMYNQAISLDPKKAAYYSNKAAALIGLGRLIEAVFECREAIKIEPFYRRAHYRLATLYFRLGQADKAQHHYTLSELKEASDDIVKCQAMKIHLVACKKAMGLKDWDSLLNESQHAISLGADSAPQINTMKVDASLNLHKHTEAYEALANGPRFNMDSCVRLFGASRSAYILSVRARVYMVVDRFEDALASIYQASLLDTSHKSKAVLKRIEAVALVRSNGNHLFNASKISEAVMEYNEGLQIDPFNSVLLFERAACKSKLGQFEKAVEDCTKALNVRPCYSMARLRRANCYAELGKWEAAIKDYEILVRDTPDDEELAKYLFEAKAQMKRQHLEETINSETKKAGKDTTYSWKTR